MKYFLLTLLLTGCMSPNITTTLHDAKTECEEIGATIKVTVKNINGKESMRIVCQWNVQEKLF